METTHRNERLKRHRLQLRKRVDLGRNGLLIIMAVTLLNQFLLMFGVEYHFLFSSAVPYYLNWLGRELAVNGNMEAFHAIAVILTVLIYAAYGACWLLSAQRREWMLAALGLYSVDTLLLVIFSATLLENPASCLFEILTHLAGVFLLFVADRAAARLSQLPHPKRSERRVEADPE